MRGLREAVAPTETATEDPQGSSNPTNEEGVSSKPRKAIHPNEDPDYDDFLLAYYHDEEWALELTSAAGGRPPRSREEYVKLRAKLEMTKHSELVPKLAQNILRTSAQVEDLVGALPGMERTREEQIAQITVLLEENLAVEKELKDAYALAESRRHEVKSKLRSVTCEALGIEEDD